MSSDIELSLYEEEVWSSSEDSSEEESQEVSQEMSKGDAKSKSVIIPKDIKYNNKPLCNRFSFRFVPSSVLYFDSSFVVRYSLGL